MKKLDRSKLFGFEQLEKIEGKEESANHLFSKVGVGEPPALAAPLDLATSAKTVSVREAQNFFSKIGDSEGP